ncbi:MAG: type II toxin-antitoxin system YafQ family toxin [Treponema sp.]|jgi:mRNA interferase YafQ|nr:type II toxin-antitoxin system YafQ family toxin [Treponema sp.]
MLDPLYTKPFRKQFRLMKKRGMDISKLIEVMDMIINEIPLLPKHRNHPLQGKWEGSFDCHIQGDWVLIYKLNTTVRTVTFQSTGTHSDLGL